MYRLLLFAILFTATVSDSDEQQCSLKRITDIFPESSLTSIPLSIYKFNGYFDTYGDFHPKNLLLQTKDNWYCSKQVKTMKGNYWCEYDWIIFKINDLNNLYLPNKIILLNHNAEAAIKLMSIYIGNIKTNEWYKIHPQILKFNMNNEYTQSQELYFDGIDWDWNLIKIKQLKYIKIVLLDNHMGRKKNQKRYKGRFPDSCNFLFYHIKFKGYKL